MKEQLEKRLTELKSEFEAGQKMMTELESKQSNLRDTLLRISGAIQILEEEINRVDETLDSVQETPVEIIN
jgi:predicted nuclease with TOPRIM domain